MSARYRDAVLRDLLVGWMKFDETMERKDEVKANGSRRSEVSPPSLPPLGTFRWSLSPTLLLRQIRSLLRYLPPGPGAKGSSLSTPIEKKE